MRLKLWVLVLVGICLFLLLANQSQAISKTELKQQLQYRLAESSPDFSDADLELCIWLAGLAVINHGLAYKFTLTQAATIFPPDSQDFGCSGAIGNFMFVTSVIRTNNGEERSLLEISLKDIGHRHLDTDVPFSYYCFYRDADSAVLFIYPASAQEETLLIEGYLNTYDIDAIYVKTLYEEVWLDYALFLAYLRLENYPAVAKAYNSYVQEIARLREELVNRQPDVTVAPKIIK